MICICWFWILFWMLFFVLSAFVGNLPPILCTFSHSDYLCCVVVSAPWVLNVPFLLLSDLSYRVYLESTVNCWQVTHGRACFQLCVDFISYFVCSFLLDVSLSYTYPQFQEHQMNKYSGKSKLLSVKLTKKKKRNILLLNLILDYFRNKQSFLLCQTR